MAAYCDLLQLLVLTMREDSNHSLSAVRREDEVFLVRDQGSCYSRKAGNREEILVTA